MRETEIVDYCPTDRDIIVLYTPDLEIYNKFSKSIKCIRADAYTDKKGEFAAGDIYFPRTYKKELRKRLERLGII